MYQPCKGSIGGLSVKYRVSLLPEQKRKRIEGRKKIEKIQVFALAVLVVLALFLIVVSITNVYADKQLAKERALDNAYAQKVAELEQFRTINATLQEKVKLIEDIQVEEPQLVNFIAKISNLETPGISINSIECTDWKVSRNCVLVGTCDNREQYLTFEKSLGEMEEISAVACASYVQNVGARVQFTINITCVGGKVIVETTQAPAEAPAEGETTAETVAAE